MLPKKYIALDLGFRNMGYAALTIWQPAHDVPHARIELNNTRWLAGQPMPKTLDVAQMFLDYFVPRLWPHIGRNTTSLILEKPYLLARSQSSTIAAPLISLYNCVYVYFKTMDPTLPIVGYPPSIKHSLYGFDTKNKDAITDWAAKIVAGVDDSIIAPATKRYFSTTPKKDDIADALFYLLHQLRLDHGLSVGAFKDPKAVRDWLHYLFLLPTEAPATLAPLPERM